MVKHSQIAFKDLVIEKELGEGSYGKVCFGRWNNAPVALKFCKKKEGIDDLVREVKIMMYVTNIIHRKQIDLNRCFELIDYDLIFDF
jgi:predicted Ser/Thr protein kinase